MGFPGSSYVKCLSAMQETWVQSLSREDPLKKEMATHSSILAWKILWMEEAGRLQSMGSQRVGNDWSTTLHFTYTLSIYIGQFPFRRCIVSITFSWGFLGSAVVENLPVNAWDETWVQSRGGEDPLEKEIATLSSILAWKISWTEDPSRLQSMGSQKSQTWLSD